MKKNCIYSWIILFIFILTALSVMIYKSSAAALTAAVMPVAAAVISAIASAVSKNSFSFSADAPVTTEKNGTVTVNVTAENRKVLLPVKVFAMIKITNRLTGEILETEIRLVSTKNKKFSGNFSFISENCGVTEIKAEKIYITDMLTLFPIRAKNEFSVKCTVLPDTFTADVNIDIPPTAGGDSDSYSDTLRGDDMTEIFQLREYTEGDALRSINWKLSEKYDKTIVKDPSLPVYSDLLLFWLRDNTKASPEITDTAAECFASVMQSLFEQGMVFTAGRNDGNELIYEFIDSEDKLFTFIQMMLKNGTGTDGELPGNNGKIIIFNSAGAILTDKKNTNILHFADENAINKNNYKEIINSTIL